MTNNFLPVWTDLVKNYWSSNGAHIVPQYQGYTSSALAQQAGANSDMQNGVSKWETQGKPLATNLWCEAQLSNVIYWYYKLTNDITVAHMLGNNFKYIYHQIGGTTMCDSSKVGGIVAASDDAAWIAQMYFQVYDACKDVSALNACKQVIESCRSAYAGPENNKYGLYYTLPNQDLNHRSSIYEVGIAITAFQIWDAGGRASIDQGWFDTALNAYNWMQQYLIHPSGAHYCEFNLNTGPGYLKPIGYNNPDDTGKMYLNGSIGMCVLGAMLFEATGDDQYRQNVIHTVSGIIKVLSRWNKARGRVFLNNRDAWTEGFFFPLFVKYVLPISGINSVTKSVIKNTATSIVSNCRTDKGFYSGDWLEGSNWGSIEERPEQMMTSANSAAVVLAATMIK